MIVGSLEDILFSVSSNTIRTFNGMNRSGSARIEHHMPINGQPVAEFIGPDVQQITFNMELKQNFNINVNNALESLRDKRDLGEICTLIIGGNYLGDWLISEVGESHNLHNRRGRLVGATASITLTNGV